MSTYLFVPSTHTELAKSIIAKPRGENIPTSEETANTGGRAACNKQIRFCKVYHYHIATHLRETKIAKINKHVKGLAPQKPFCSSAKIFANDNRNSTNMTSQFRKTVNHFNRLVESKYQRTATNITMRTIVCCVDCITSRISNQYKNIVC